MYLWNQLQNAWVKDIEGEISTYNPFDAQKFKDDFEFDQCIYVKHDNDLFERKLEKIFDYVKDVKIVLKQFNIGFRTKYKFNVVEPVNQYYSIFENKKDHVLVETSEKYGFNISGYWYVFDTLNEAILNLREQAIEQMTHDGSRNFSLYIRYMEIAKEYNFVDPINHIVENYSMCPSHQIKKGDLIGTIKNKESFRIRSDYDYSISKTMRNLITKFRFGNNQKSIKLRKKITGKLPCEAKEYIRMAHRIMKEHSCIYVISNKYHPSQPYVANCCYINGSGYNSYQYLYVANIDGKEKSFFCNNEIHFIKDGDITKNGFLEEKPLELNEKIELSKEKINEIIKEHVKNQIKEFRFENRSLCKGYSIPFYKKEGGLNGHLKNIIRQSVEVIKNQYEIRICGVEISNENMKNPIYKYKLLFKQINEEKNNIYFAPPTLFSI